MKSDSNTGEYVSRIFIGQVARYKCVL